MCLQLTRAVDSKKTEAEKAEEQDAEILAAIAARRKLASDLELAKGVQYTEPMKTSYVLALKVSKHVLTIYMQMDTP